MLFDSHAHLNDERFDEDREELISSLQEKGVDLAFVTLHVGLGTFRPVKVDDVLENDMHSEYYMVTQEASDKINRAK